MINHILPIIQVKKANKIIKDKMEKIDNIDFPQELESTDIRFLEKDFENSLLAKDRLEDKAKTILAALTIAVTLILNISSILDAITLKINLPLFNYLIFAIAFLAIIYMLMAGILSIQVLTKENIGFTIPATEKSTEDKEQLYLYTKSNNYQNTVRNNMIFGSYQSIINSIICLVILFIVAIFPFQLSEENEQYSYQGKQIQNIYFNIESAEWITDNPQAKDSLKKIIEKYDDNGKKTQNLYDNNILITLSKENDIYIIKNIISDITMIE